MFISFLVGCVVVVVLWCICHVVGMGAGYLLYKLDPPENDWLYKELPWYHPGFVGMGFLTILLLGLITLVIGTIGEAFLSAAS